MLVHGYEVSHIQLLLKILESLLFKFHLFIFSAAKLHVKQSLEEVDLALLEIVDFILNVLDVFLI